MYITFKTVEGYQEEKPKLVDLTSSKGNVYLRKNIVEVPNLDAEGNELDTVHYKYDEAFLTLEEYEQYLEEIQSPSIQMLMQTLSDIQLQIDML